ncbi:MAG: hypothetical protein QF752_14160, partial [Planctomycetota bacterium]|nr:hypothetical protein [Planctomycetota bacterium]
MSIQDRNNTFLNFQGKGKRSSEINVMIRTGMFVGIFTVCLASLAMAGGDYKAFDRDGDGTVDEAYSAVRVERTLGAGTGPLLLESDGITFDVKINRYVLDDENGDGSVDKKTKITLSSDQYKAATQALGNALGIINSLGGAKTDYCYISLKVGTAVYSSTTNYKLKYFKITFGALPKNTPVLVWFDIKGLKDGSGAFLPRGIHIDLKTFDSSKYTVQANLIATGLVRSLGVASSTLGPDHTTGHSSWSGASADTPSVCTLFPSEGKQLSLDDQSSLRQMYG